MTARQDMIAHINNEGAALLWDGLEILIVAAYPSGNDTILVTPNWIEEQPASFPFHRLKGAVSATEEGWAMGTARTENGERVEIRWLSDGVPEAQDQYTAYQQNLAASGRDTAELEPLIRENVQDGWV